jgi:hypothetical protein
MSAVSGERAGGFTYEEFAALCALIEFNPVRLGDPLPCGWALDEGELVEVGGKTHSRADTIVYCKAPATFGWLERGRDGQGYDAWVVVPICPTCCLDFQECARWAAKEWAKRERQREEQAGGG